MRILRWQTTAYRQIGGTQNQVLGWLETPACWIAFPLKNVIYVTFQVFNCNKIWNNKFRVSVLLGLAPQEELLYHKSALQLAAICTAALPWSQQPCQNLKRVHVTIKCSWSAAYSWSFSGIWLDGLPGTVYAPIVSMLAKVSHTPWSHFRWPSSWAKTA